MPSASLNAGNSERRQACLVVNRAKARAALAVKQGTDAIDWHIREFGQQILEHRHIAAEQRAQDQLRRELAVAAQVPDQQDLLALTRTTRQA